MKEQNKTPEKELNKMETNNPPDSELKILAVSMLNNVKGRVDKFSENFDKKIGNKNGGRTN